MISLDGPAQVNDGGRRRDGGSGFAIVSFYAMAKTRDGKP